MARARRTCHSPAINISHHVLRSPKLPSVALYVVGGAFQSVFDSHLPPQVFNQLAKLPAKGSLTTMPFSRTYTRVLTVPKSIAKSSENKLNNGRRLSREIRVTQSKRILPRRSYRRVCSEQFCHQPPTMGNAAGCRPADTVETWRSTGGESRAESLNLVNSVWVRAIDVVIVGDGLPRRVFANGCETITCSAALSWTF
jgi:hypothetical protein